MTDIEKTPAFDAAIKPETDVKGETELIKGGGDSDNIGLELFKESLQYDTAQLERDAVKVRRKLDFIVLPMVKSSLISFPSAWLITYR